MKSLIFDTDILSTFGKIKRLDLLQELIPDIQFSIPTSVYNELLKAKDHGYDFVNYIFESGIIEVTILNRDEWNLSWKLRIEHTSLGAGELEGISICKYRNYVLVTNDITAKNVCDQYGVQFIDLSMILKSLLEEKILTNNEIKALIGEIELKDKVIIKDKDDIWTTF
ncbi:MAG: hypothetical protein ACNYWM_12080 [Methanosarcinales archaeon]